MPKENKNTSRRSRRQCSETDNETVSGVSGVSAVPESLKSTIKGNRYSPFPREVSRKDSKATKKNMFMPSIEDLHSMSNIIESGIKYIMFPLHLLRFCIFGTNSSGSLDSKEHTTTRQEKSNDRNNEEINEKIKTRKERKDQSLVKETSNDKFSKNVESSKPASYSADERKHVSSRSENFKEDKSDSEKSNNEMVTAEEDSDSSAEQWSSASSTMIMNMSVDYGNHRSTSYAVLEEPMDISIEEHTCDKTYSVIKMSQNSRRFENVQNNIIESISATYNDEQDSNSSVDEEISRIFRKQCTSSDDEFPSSSLPKSSSTSKHEKTKRNNFLYNPVNNNTSSVTSRSRNELQDDERERKTKTSTEFLFNNKRRKLAYDEVKKERHAERKCQNKMREEKRSSRQDTPSKYKLRSARTPVKDKESKRKDIKYKETATQTDSAFSDDDVEMVLVDTKVPEKPFCSKYATHKSQLHPFQGKGIEQEINYVADNEDSNDGFLRIAHKRISSCSTSSSSTDLGFDERASATPDTDIAVEQWRMNSPDSTSTSRMCTRAPPGFPEVPQNPPLTPYINNDFKSFILKSSKDNNSNSSLIKMVAIVPPAPSPMRHLYYDYPEFMDLPVYVNSSKILNNILKNNYYR